MATLRIIFTILSALCLAAILPAGTFGGMPYFFICAGGAGVFFLLMLLCKRKQEVNEPKEKTPDFLNSEEKTEKTEEEK
jgi:hypothetical protein